MGIARDMQNAIRMQVCEADKGIQELGAHLDEGRPLVGWQDVPAKFAGCARTLVQVRACTHTPTFES